MESGLLALVILAVMLALLCLGVPIAFTLCGLATGGILYKLGPKGLLLLFNTAYGESTNFLLIAVPLFIFMANQLKFTGIGDELYAMMYRWLGRLPGGLAVGTVIICAVFAAMAGISSVATVSMGLIALPSMLNRGYNRFLAIGCISAGGALGILIPPSIIMVIYGAIAEVSIGKLFIGGIIPGILLTIIYVVYIFVMAWWNPSLAPPITETFTWREKLSSVKGVFLPIFLIILVLGVIYLGICTPTEASAVGAFGAILCAFFYNKLSWNNLKEALFHTMKINAMVFWLIIGAMSFTHFAAYAEIQTLVQNSILALPVSPWTIMIAMQFIFFILGMFLDPAGIIMLTVPIFVPVVKALGFDTLWFGILFVVNMEMAYITPPFGFNLFIMRAIVPAGVNMTDIYRSIVPFVVLQAICLAMIMIWPGLATWLPGLMITR